MKILTIFLTMIMTAGAQNLSHTKRTESLQEVIDKIGEKIRTRKDLPYASVSKQLEWLEALSQFELGRFLLQRGGLNGYWTQFIVTYPERKEKIILSPLEAFLLEKAPVCLATQERFQIFKQEIQKRLPTHRILASIPSGLMGEFLQLDFSQIPSFSLYGIDTDLETLAEATKLAEEMGLSSHCQFFQQNAWALNQEAQFDLIASNGLSIYEADDEKVTLLYRQFFKALKPGGVLITSFLTPPPIPGKQTEWKVEAVNPEDALLQKLIFSDILEAKWQIFRTEELVKSQLRKAGFTHIEILYDKAHIFPTVIAS